MKSGKRLAPMAILLAFGCQEEGSIKQPCFKNGTCRGNLVCRHVADSIMDGALYRCVPNDVPLVQAAKPDEIEDHGVMNAALAAALTAAMMCH